MDIIRIDENLIKTLNSLPEDYWDFKNENYKEFTHGIHTYPAVMISPISRNIIKILRENSYKIESILDPYMGSGTVLLEGCLAGIESVYGSDLNPLAKLISAAKLKKIDKTLLENKTKILMKNLDIKYKSFSNVIKKVNSDLEAEKIDLTAKDGWGSDASYILQEYINKSNLTLQIPKFKNIGYWFKPSVILELQLIKDCITTEEDELIRNYMLVAMSELVRVVSNRRNGEFKMFRISKDKLKTFEPNVLSEFNKILCTNVHKMIQYVEYCNQNKLNSKVYIKDENAMLLETIPDNSIDLMVTSPPYGDSKTTVAYGEFSRLSLQWINLNNISQKDISNLDQSLMGGKKFRNGFEFNIKSKTLNQELNQIKNVDLIRAGDVYSFYLDLDKCICTISKKMKPNSYQFWVVGNRTVKNVTLHTDKIIVEIAKNYGLVPIYSIKRNILNKVMPSLNSPTNMAGKKVKTICNEHILVLKKSKTEII